MKNTIMDRYDYVMHGRIYKVRRSRCITSPALLAGWSHERRAPRPSLAVTIVVAAISCPSCTMAHPSV